MMSLALSRTDSTKVSWSASEHIILKTLVEATMNEEEGQLPVETIFETEKELARAGLAIVIVNVMEFCWTVPPDESPSGVVIKTCDEVTTAERLREGDGEKDTPSGLREGVGLRVDEPAAAIGDRVTLPERRIEGGAI